MWRAVYGWPDRDLKIYGVTGTNGKTTTSILLGSIMREEYGIEKVGLLTTIVFWLGSDERVNATKMTTMDSHDVFRYLKEMKDKEVEHVVLEVTSHALDQNRLAGTRLDGAVILNIAREHLDYHGTMEEYAKAKARIVDLLQAGAPLVALQDDSYISKALARVKRSDFHIKDIWFTSEQAQQVETELAGQVNKENALAAGLLARAIGIDEGEIKIGIANVEHVPGRMEWIDIKSKFQNPNVNSMSKSKAQMPQVLIDYAVTPDALDRLYKEVRSVTKGKIYAVLGACGNRDRGKRADMTRVVAQYADELVLTREDPWAEDEEQIFSDLEKGLTKHTIQKAQSTNKVQNQEHKSLNTRCEWQRVIDRREAIKYCIDKAGPEDVVVVTGKGAEVGMAIGNKVIPWSDKEVIQELLAAKK